MANPAKTLKQAIEETGLGSLISELQFIEPPLSELVFQRIQEYRECVIVGPPRSGKTILAIYSGQKIQLERSNTVIVLDFNDVQKPKLDFTDIQRYYIRKGDLIIIDNWHSRPDCQDELDILLQSRWKDVNVLYVVTRLESGENDSTTLIPSLYCSPDEVVDNPINTEDSLQEVADKMINNRVWRHKRVWPGAEISIDDQDLETALTMHTKYKRMRGNLRYLMWRLEAWNPQESHLRDVEIQEVMQMIRRHLVQPAGRYIGDLQEVAVVAQWEVPYRIPPGANLPEGFLHLKQENLISCSSGPLAWYMDSTDAHLMLEYLWGTRWPEETVKVLTSYLNKSINQVPTMLSRVMRQAEKDVRSHIIIGLLANHTIFNAERASLLQIEENQSSTIFNVIFELVNTIFSNLPRDETQRRERVSLGSKIFWEQELLSEEVGRTAGKVARKRSIYTSIIIMKLLKKDLEHSRPFVKAFLTSFGEDDLQKKIDDRQSGLVQRDFLRTIVYFDPDLGRCLKNRITLKPRPIGLGVQRSVRWLASGTLQWGRHRLNKIQYLEMLEEEEIEKFTKLQHPLGWLQMLLLNALWLAPEQAKRISRMIKYIWPYLNMEQENFRNLSLLLANSRHTDQNVSANLVDFILDEPYIFPMLSKSTDSQPESLSRFFIAMENAQPGSIEKWFKKYFEDSLEMLVSLDDESLNAILITLALLAPENFKVINDNRAMQQRLLKVDDNAQQCMRRGILACSGLAPLDTTETTTLTYDTLVKFEPLQILLMMFGIQSSLGISSMEDILKCLLIDNPLVPSTASLIIQLGRHPMPLTASSLRSMGRNLLRAPPNPRTRALEYIVLATHLLSELTWDRQLLAEQSIDQGMFSAPANVRGLVTAGYERLLWLKAVEGDPIIHATLNGQHPFVKRVQQQLEIILEPLTDQTLNLTQWDIALTGRMLINEVDRWRYRLIKADKVRCNIDVGSGMLEMKFSLVHEPVKDVVRQLIFQNTDLI